MGPCRADVRGDCGQKSSGKGLKVLSQLAASTPARDVVARTAGAAPGQTDRQTDGTFRAHSHSLTGDCVGWHPGMSPGLAGPPSLFPRPGPFLVHRARTQDWGQRQPGSSDESPDLGSWAPSLGIPTSPGPASPAAHFLPAHTSPGVSTLTQRSTKQAFASEKCSGEHLPALPGHRATSRATSSQGAGG